LEQGEKFPPHDERVAPKKKEKEGKKTNQKILCSGPKIG